MSRESNPIYIFTPIAIPNRTALEYPFSFIVDEEYQTRYFCRGLPDEEPLDCGDFPNNITEYYWIHEGENDVEPWMCLCKLDNNCYCFYSASCDYTGFDCQGGMEMVISKDKENLVEMGLTDRQREILIADKKEGGQKARVHEDFSWPIPVPPPINLVNPTKAFIRIWHNDEELILNMDYVNGLEMEALEYAIRRLTTTINTSGEKKHYNMNLCCSPVINNINTQFKKKFKDHTKKWELRMKAWGGSMIRKWGKVEVSFILF